MFLFWCNKPQERLTDMCMRRKHGRNFYLTYMRRTETVYVAKPTYREKEKMEYVDVCYISSLCTQPWRNLNVCLHLLQYKAYYRVDTDWKVRENSIIFRVVRESQGKSGKVRESQGK